MLIASLSSNQAFHLAVALRRHRKWLPTQGLRVPAGWAELEAAFELTARSRPGPTDLAGFAEVEESAVVAPRLLTFDDVSDALNVSKRTVERLVAAGELASVEVRSQPRVRVGDLDAYVASLRPRARAAGAGPAVPRSAVGPATPAPAPAPAPDRRTTEPTGVQP